MFRLTAIGDWPRIQITVKPCVTKFLQCMSPKLLSLASDALLGLGYSASDSTRDVSQLHFASATRPATGIHFGKPDPQDCDKKTVQLRLQSREICVGIPPLESYAHFPKQYRFGEIFGLDRNAATGIGGDQNDDSAARAGAVFLY